MFTLRPYQQRCVDAALAEIRKTVDPCLIDAAPAAGKSFMIAAIADALNRMSGKRVLCLAPSAELVKQNHAKYLLTGEKASIFSASAGAKSTRHTVVFGTPKTVANSIARFLDGYCAVIVDECHGITPTIKGIIEDMRAGNPLLRVIGLSGTPYRLGTGYVFRIWPNGTVNDEDVTREPYFSKCVYRVTAREMLDGGFITPMTIGEINSSGYDTSGIHLLPNGTPNPDDVERAFVGHGRKTAGIVADVLAQVANRPGGVMYFAATVRHAEEVLASLPPGNSALVTGETKPADRRRIIEDYRAQRIRHLVSVGTLTTGFDVEHTGTIALLRYTESAALLQQILGRAWRLHPAKADSLLLDYAENVERHFPDGNIYEPVVRATASSGGGTMEAECPDCGYVNAFKVHKDYKDFAADQYGYCMDEFGGHIMSEYGPIPAHYGRRCLGHKQTGERGEYERCGYRWTSKECPECGEGNDIAARYCIGCKGELVDPNEKLVADFKALKKDPTQPQTDIVLHLTCVDSVSRAGNPVVKVDWVTPYRSFTTWFQPNGTHWRACAEWARFNEIMEQADKPDTVTYVKDADSGFYRIIAYNQPADEEPATNEVSRVAKSLWEPRVSREVSA